MASDTPMRELLTVIRLQADLARGLAGAKELEKRLQAHQETVRRINASAEAKRVRDAARLIEGMRKTARKALAEKARIAKKAADQAARDIQRAADREARLRKQSEDRAVRDAKRLADRQASVRRRAIDEQRKEFEGLRTWFAAGIGFAAIRGFQAVFRSFWFTFHEILQDVSDEADEAEVNSIRMGVTSQQAQQLKYVSKLAGTGWDETMTVFRFMADAIQDFKIGKGSGIDVIKQMGLAGAVMAGKLDDPFLAFMRITKEIQKYQPGVATHLMRQLGGRGGAKVLPAMQADIAGSTVQELMDEYVDFWGVVGDDLVLASQKWNDELDRSQTILFGIRNVLAQDVIPSATQALRAFRLWARAHRDEVWEGLRNIRQTMLRIVSLTALILERTERTVTMFTTWDNVAKGLLVTLTAVSAVLGSIAASVAMHSGMALFERVSKLFGLTAAFEAGGIGGAMGRLFAPLLKLGKWAAILALVALAVDDIFTFMRGGESVTERIYKKFFGIFLNTEQTNDAISAMRDNFMALWEISKSISDFFWSQIVLAFETMRWLTIEVVELLNKIPGIDLDVGLGDFLRLPADLLGGGAKGLDMGTAMIDKMTSALRASHGVGSSTSVNSSQTNVFTNTPRPVAAAAFLHAKQAADARAAQR